MDGRSRPPEFSSPLPSRIYSPRRMLFAQHRQPACIFYTDGLQSDSAFSFPGLQTSDPPGSGTPHHLPAPPLRSGTQSGWRNSVPQPELHSGYIRSRHSRAAFPPSSRTHHRLFHHPLCWQSALSPVSECLFLNGYRQMGYSASTSES